MTNYAQLWTETKQFNRQRIETLHKIFALHRKLKNWTIPGWEIGSSDCPISEMIFTCDIYSVYGKVKFKKDEHFIKNTHIISDELIHFLGLNVENLRFNEYGNTLDLNTRLLRVEFFLNGTCRAIKKTKLVTTEEIIGYEC